MSGSGLRIPHYRAAAEAGLLGAACPVTSLYTCTVNSTLVQYGAAQSAGPGWIFVNFIMRRETDKLDISSFFVIDEFMK